MVYKDLNKVQKCLTCQTLLESVDLSLKALRTYKYKDLNEDMYCKYFFIWINFN